MTLLLELVGEFKTKDILASKIAYRQSLDKYIWTLAKDGNFSMTSAWEVTRFKGEYQEWTKCIWYEFLPIKISLYMWKETFKFFPVDEKIREIGIS